MFGFRADGTLVKDIDPIEKIVPYIMFDRNDACNLANAEIVCDDIDKWIKKEYEEHGLEFNYMHIIMAAGIRIFALRQKLNRFVVNGRIYQRNALQISLTIKENLRDDSPDISIKMRFTGQENIYEVKEIIDRNIKEALQASAQEHGTTKVAKFLTHVPAGLIKFGVGLVKALDRGGMLPKSILDVSPFHTSFYVTNLKSIKGDAIYHHLYNFGTTGVFIAMGKESMKPVIEKNGDIVTKKVMKLGFTVDERFCDGFYFVKTLRTLKRIIANPAVLEQRLDIEPIESKKERKQRLKAIEKEQKAKEKYEKKNSKK